ncbi:MAG: translational GTPase TypA [Ruminococcaceae bacterium]|nr:translational GTPase TypA [Oscillospiraceae bacterium]
MIEPKNIRNIAIIAHVDHGKTTLVDALLRQSGVFRENAQVEERVMDSNDIERERGITILAKNTSLMYNGVKINIIDTPGHADFGGEVERGLKMADGVLLLVDAFEGCMPQTRFVLKKALELNLAIIMVVNKADRPNARPYEVTDELLELFIDLEATDDQLDSPVVYVSGRDGWASLSPDNHTDDLKVLFDLIVSHIPAPRDTREGEFQMLVSNIDYDTFTGRIAVGRINRGFVKTNMPITISRDSITPYNSRVSKLFSYKDLEKQVIDEAGAGEIVAISGVEKINIGDTICAAGVVEPLPFTPVDEPVLSMTFSVNNSPFAGQDGDYVTSRHLRDRLMKELESNIALKVTETDSPDSFVVSGRGELHLSVLIENMRREGYEFQVSKPKTINKEIDGVMCEPIEMLTVDVPDEYTGVVMEGIGARKGTLSNMTPGAAGYTKLEFRIPSRGLIGYRGELLTATKGTGVINSIFDSYEPVIPGEFTTRSRGSLVAYETGESVAYGLFNSQDRGQLFIGAGEKVYQGMVVGECSRLEDIVVNVCKRKQATNMRAAGSDEALRLTPPKLLSLEESLEFLADDELLEVTPNFLRIRKRILDTDLRAKEANRIKKQQQQ